MKKCFEFIVLIGAVFLLIGCKEYKYNPGRDTLAYFGDEAKYQIWRIEPYQLEDMENNEIIEEGVYSYKRKGDKVYIIGMEGYTVINLNNYEYNQSKELEAFHKNDVEVFESNKFKEVSDREYIKVPIENIIDNSGNYTDKCYFLMGYNKKDNVSKEYLQTNENILREKIRIYFIENSVEDNEVDEKLMNYINKEIPELKLKIIRIYGTWGK